MVLGGEEPLSRCTTYSISTVQCASIGPMCRHWNDVTPAWVSTRKSWRGGDSEKKMKVKGKRARVWALPVQIRNISNLPMRGQLITSQRAKPKRTERHFEVPHGGGGRCIKTLFLFAFKCVWPPPTTKRDDCILRQFASNYKLQPITSIDIVCLVIPGSAMHAREREGSFSSTASLEFKAGELPMVGQVGQNRM